MWLREDDTILTLPKNLTRQETIKTSQLIPIQQQNQIQEP
jgi:hypothetical protein